MIEFKWIEWLGYLASIIVAVSLTMANIRRLRWINLLGASAFTLYGWILNLYPVFFVNLFITFINIYYLIRMSLTKDRFHLIPISWKTSIFLPRFIEFYLDDIQNHFGNIDIDFLKNYDSIFITRNVVPVGLFIYEKENDGIIKIHLDYEVPTYRDYETARYFFREFRELMNRDGYHTYITFSTISAHQKYLKIMNFIEDKKEPGKFIRKI
ncbi:MAG: hypothetical protein HOK52_02505 [Candidatus Marinimicrobia bacterium]|jgi:hypothetical protein|nr:hypothetical protein [Candidatus Neomarinimicrobiota bacterium]MBT3937950.1 hypothetical protein [Candidatus Neomarinimicrobiota bacterium]MBT3962208.1 hypothetical protein [Candidatus Neomarinimicrobiota bacterium]MBT4383781.1 hypothetical protein [Candidatus Neomarinimicrobiota bacterium]MBT4636927.1 hypothetical protein [Candidatus Neomarinimicrobiota bacterium]